MYLEGSLLKPNMVTPGQVTLLLELQKNEGSQRITITEITTRSFAFWTILRHYAKQVDFAWLA